jgi:hypothetical protein
VQQFAALDDFARELRESGTIPDLVAWVVARQEATEPQLRKMAADRTLPVLQDTEAARVDQLYGRASARGYLIFGRDGCLVPTDTLVGAHAMADPSLLLPYLPQ